MDKERDTKAIKKIIDKTYGESSTAVLRNRLTAEYRVICNEEVAKAIVEAGYGDTKQALREFADRLKEKIDKIEKHCLEMHNWQGQSAVCEVEAIIDELLAEVIGE